TRPTAYGILNTEYFSSEDSGCSVEDWVWRHFITRSSPPPTAARRQTRREYSTPPNPGAAFAPARAATGWFQRSSGCPRNSVAAGLAPEWEGADAVVQSP